MRFLTLTTALSVLAAAASAQCSPPSLGAVDANLSFADGWESHAIGFAFPFNGGTYTDMYVSDHGVIAFHNAGVPAVPPENAQLWDPGSAPNTAGLAGGGLAGFGVDVVCAYWGDHTNFGNSAAEGVFVDNTSGTSAVVTWANHEPYNFLFGTPALAFTCQLALYADGRIQINLDNRCNNTGSEFDPITTVIGVQLAADAVPAAGVDLSMSPVVAANSFFEEFTGPGPVGTSAPDPNFDLGNTQLTLIPTSPGWAVIAAALPCATSVSTGTGCNGLVLDSVTEPVIGAMWSLELSGVNATTESLGLPSFVFFGAPTGAVPIGTILPTLFGPSCNVYMDAALGNIDIGAAVAGVATGGFVLPADMALIGTPLDGQAMSWDDPFGTPLFALSNLETGTIGL